MPVSYDHEKAKAVGKKALNDAIKSGREFNGAVVDMAISAALHGYTVNRQGQKVLGWNAEDSRIGAALIQEALLKNRIKAVQYNPSLRGIWYKRR